MCFYTQKLYASVHNIIIHHNQKTEITLMPSGDKGTICACPCNGILFGYEKEQNPDVCYTWVDLINMMLSEASPAQKAACHRTPFAEMSSLGEHTERKCVSEFQELGQEGRRE